MEMDRGRAYPQRLSKLAQAEPVWADALDQLGGGGDDRIRQAGAGSGLPFLLNIWTRGLLFRYGDGGHDDARDEEGGERPKRIGRSAHYWNSATRARSLVTVYPAASASRSLRSLLRCASPRFAGDTLAAGGNE